MAWLPRIFGIADIVPLPVCTPLKWNKEFSSTVTGLTVFLHERLVSQITVNVDLLKQRQTLAREPHSVIVELINYLFVIEVTVSTVVLVPEGPIPRIICFTIA